MKRLILFVCGFALVTLGIALVFRHWQATVTVFQGVMPAAMAVAGMVVLFIATIKK